MQSASGVSPKSEPKYVRLADHLRRQIEQGALKPGDRLPSHMAIREQHHLTQPTIERAQAILEREGLIVRRERQGVFVAEPTGTGQKKNGSHNSGGSARLASNTVGILTSHESRVMAGHRQPGWSDYTTQGALTACHEQGKHALFLNPARLQSDDVKSLLVHPPLGFLFSGLTPNVDFGVVQELLRTLHRSNQAVVVFGNEVEFRDFDRVACDHETGCYELTRWLIGRGCRRILPFWPPLTQGGHWLEERLAGYRRAMREAGLDPLPVREVPLRHLPNEPDDTLAKFEATTRHKAGYLADYLGSKRRCDAILEVSDGDVPTTAAACRLLGHEPNRDVLIAGYDNYWRDTPELAFEPTTPIATVDKHNWQTGRELVEVLLARVAGQLGAEPELRLVQPELLSLDVLAPSVLRAHPQRVAVAA